MQGNKRVGFVGSNKQFTTTDSRLRQSKSCLGCGRFSGLGGKLRVAWAIIWYLGSADVSQTQSESSEEVDDLVMITTTKVKSYAQPRAKFMLHRKGLAMNRASTVQRSLTRLNANIEEWIKEGRLYKIFQDINKSIKTGRELDLNEIGIKRTPFYRLSQKEKAEKAVVRRKDFIDILKCEQECSKNCN